MQLKNTNKGKRKSTLIRINAVHAIYEKLRQQYDPNIFNNLSRSFIYSEIGKETGLCSKTISTYLNRYSAKEISSE